MNHRLLLICEFVWTKSARTFGFGLPLKFECTNGLVFLDSALYPSAFHLVSPPSSTATLLCEKYSESHTPLAVGDALDLIIEYDKLFF